MIAMQLKLHESLTSLKMVASLATFVKQPDSLDSTVAVSNSVKEGPLGGANRQPSTLESSAQSPRRRELATPSN